MAGGLKGRLARLRGEAGRQDLSAEGLTARDPLATGGAKEPRRAAMVRQRHHRVPPPFLEGWTEIAELVWSRELRRPLDFPPSIDPRPFMSMLALRRMGTGGQPGGAPDQVTRGEVAAVQREAAPIPSALLRFFDLETTGLSGGSGTIAFLAAVGRVGSGGLVITQLFLEDYPGERVWLDRLLGHFGPDAVAVTYNGRAFDMPLLRTRCIMNGMAPPALPHIDALAAARRLWKSRAGGASLALIERAILDLRRVDDIPGSLIPELWLSFLRSGEAPLMATALSHNADDIEGLARIVGRIADLYDDPSASAASEYVDAGGLGRSLAMLGRFEEAEPFLRSSLMRGEEDSGLRLARILWRSGRMDELRAVVELLPQSLGGCLLRSRVQERVLGDARSALQWASRAERLAPSESQRAALARRCRRLRARVGKDGEGSGEGAEP